MKKEFKVRDSAIIQKYKEGEVSNKICVGSYLACNYSMDSRKRRVLAAAILKRDKDFVLFFDLKFLVTRRKNCQ